MRHILSLLVIVVFITSCEPKLKPEQPQGLISKGDMVNVLYDMFVINSAKGINRKVLEVNGLFPENYILEKYKIDSLQFAQSNNYYAHDLEVYASIIEDVKAKIEKEKKVFLEIDEKEQEAAKKRRDSIKEERIKNKDSEAVQEIPKRRGN